MKMQCGFRAFYRQCGSVIAMRSHASIIATLHASPKRFARSLVHARTDVTKLQQKAETQITSIMVLRMSS